MGLYRIHRVPLLGLAWVWNRWHFKGGSELLAFRQGKSLNTSVLSLILLPENHLKERFDRP
jgi:hypothetical protein